MLSLSITPEDEPSFVVLVEDADFVAILRVFTALDLYEFDLDAYDLEP